LRRSLALLLALTLVLAGCDLGEDESSPTPQVGVQADEDQAAEKLGFPASATRNTTRVGGADAAADAAGPEDVSEDEETQRPAQLTH
jgi:hypothetical protein